jgi:Mn2+/Fe2+ NRAMP family transporter
VLIILGAIVALVPGIPQIKLLVFTQCINGLLLPVILAAVVLLSSDEAIMGEYRNSSTFNLAAWAVTVTVSLLSLLLLAITIADMF